ncbi:MAG: hypothetical protein RL329_3575, partial [Bacteroidota bacterium]
FESCKINSNNNPTNFKNINLNFLLSVLQGINKMPLLNKRAVRITPDFWIR